MSEDRADNGTSSELPAPVQIVKSLNRDHLNAVESIEAACDDVATPLQRLERGVLLCGDLFKRN